MKTTLERAAVLRRTAEWVMEGGDGILRSPGNLIAMDAPQGQSACAIGYAALKLGHSPGEVCKLGTDGSIRAMLGQDRWWDAEYEHLYQELRKAVNMFDLKHLNDAARSLTRVAAELEATIATRESELAASAH